MKQFFSLVAAVCMSTAAFAQAHCEWTGDQLPKTLFETTDAAVAAGYNTVWKSADYLGMPSCDLINSANIHVSLPLAYNYVGKGNNKYSGEGRYGYRLIMGMNNTTRDGIDPSYFIEGVTGNDYVRTLATSDQGNVVNDAIIKIETKEAALYGTVTLVYSRGGNNSAMYVVDATADRTPRMVLHSVSRNADGHTVDQVVRFGVEPNRTYYVMASEKSSVELYGISYDECADDAYTTVASEENCTDLWTGDQLPKTLFETTDAAVAAGYNTVWKSADYLGMPSCDLINSANIHVSLPLAYNYVGKGNNKYSGEGRYGYRLIMGMNNTTRDGIDPSYFIEGVTNNDYVRTLATSDQGNVVNDAIIKISAPAEGTYGRVILNYNRGGNNSAMYVVDATEGKTPVAVLQAVTRCPDDMMKDHSAIFNVQPGHDYYVMASEKGSVEMYAIGYCAADSEKYGALGLATGIQTVNAGTATSANNRIYSIDGKCVGTDASALSKGVYIMNGKKFVK